ncbi:MBL fold metallo-hydrolase [Pantanalinema rosaneae CENA516]|uniref:MBL fold metallo-hydrolase n=1 Tax=Pantanalinema rosaneae TaxID=1620701 RepID=UPI003D6FBD87
MTTLLFLGSGSAFTVGVDNFHSNMLLTTDQGKSLLIDCGSDIRFSLHAAGMSYLDVTDIYISHLHSDHVGGLEYVGFTRKFDPRCDRPRLYLNAKIAAELWDRTLSGGMRSLHQEIAELDTFFDVRPVEQQGSFVWEGIRFQLVQMIHVHNGVDLMPTYGLWFELHGRKIFISTDTQLCLDQNQAIYEAADLIFHDCEISQFPTPVHSHYQELVTLADHLRQKMWLYGYQPGELPDAVADGFQGFVKRGQVFEFCPHSTVEPHPALTV